MNLLRANGDVQAIVLGGAVAATTALEFRGRGSMTHLRVAVDIGGTFTDVCILDERSGMVRVAKTASTPDPWMSSWPGSRKAEVTGRHDWSGAVP